MKANDTLMMKFLEGSKQFIVPLFQRTYSWGKIQIETLWNDIESTKNGEEKVHFFGSFVTEPLPSSASGVSKYVIIDGQQRLTATFLFLASLRNRIREIAPDSQKNDEIHELYLTNRYYPDDKYKLVPTQADRQIFFSVIENKADNPNYHLIYYARDFFKEKLSELSDLNELEKLKKTVLNHFSAVDVRLENDDDPYLIFESLNATGMPLTQADLIRNYLFMKVSLDNQEPVYNDLWFPMQQSLDKYLESFVRHYLAREGDIPSFGRIYSTFKEKANKNAKNESQVIILIKELGKFASYYDKLLHPEKEKQWSIKSGLEKLNRLEVTTSYPLLLMFYDDYTEGRLSNDDFTGILKLIETFIVRRSVCGVPPNILNKYFPSVYGGINKNDTIESLRQKLKEETGQRRMPSSNEFESALINNNLYENRILRYLLEEIEKYDNKEVVDFAGLQIEHIMPQTLSEEWKKELGSNYELIHQEYTYKLGNLTLTGYNPQYSNKTFPEKRDMKKGFRESNLKINAKLAKNGKWTEQEIMDRSKELADIALKIWKT